MLLLDVITGNLSLKEEMGKESIKSHEDLVVYQMAFEAAMKIFNLSKTFPVEERYSLTDSAIQIEEIISFVIILIQ